jgi:hypothetical protein
MTMVSSSYVMNHDLSQPEVVDLLVVGFTGTLQSWWEKHLTDESRASIRSTIKKEILSIVLCISKFQDDLLNQKFLIRVDCMSAKHVLEKDVQNIASKQIFARWQAILSIFDFDIEYIKGSQNSIPGFLTREFLQGKNG